MASIDKFDIWQLICQLCMNKQEDIDIDYQLELIGKVLQIHDEVRHEA